MKENLRKQIAELIEPINGWWFRVRGEKKRQWEKERDGIANQIYKLFEQKPKEKLTVKKSLTVEEPKKKVLTEDVSGICGGKLNWKKRGYEKKWHRDFVLFQKRLYGYVPSKKYIWGTIEWIENLELTFRGKHAKDHNQGYINGFKKGYLDGKFKAKKETT